jgi:hypothetical protein
MLDRILELLCLRFYSNNFFLFFLDMVTEFNGPSKRIILVGSRGL